MIADGCGGWRSTFCSALAAAPGDQVSLIRSSGSWCANPGQVIDLCSCSAFVQFSMLVFVSLERILA
jgi:hypothetical protein